jgi:hypothetical protein
MMQNELTQPGPLLDAGGKLAQVGWSRQPLLDCNLENAHFYKIRPLQRLRVKRWDYYAVFTPNRFFSATIADLGYAGNIFVYTLDFNTAELHEEGLVIPFGNGIRLERNPEAGGSLPMTGLADFRRMGGTPHDLIGRFSGGSRLDLCVPCRDTSP